MRNKMILVLSMVSSLVMANSKPNILFILTDDQRNDTMGCAGNPIIKTPALDGLAARGVRFENAFVTTSICAASRASIFTGLTERTHGYTFKRPPITKAVLKAGYPLLLRNHGYYTGFFGKYGVEGDIKPEEMFDEYENLHRSPYFKDTPKGRVHVDDMVADRGVAFLKAQSADKPFCLSISFNIPHGDAPSARNGDGYFPFPKSVASMYEGIEIPAPRLGDQKYFEAAPTFLQESMNRKRGKSVWGSQEKYDKNILGVYRMISAMDNYVGRFVKALDEKGLSGNTVIIFTSDNGAYMGDRGFQGKWSHYEQSLRVPMIITDPRLPKERQGKVLKEMVLNIDVTPTILELAGCPVPATYQGRSLLPLLSGKPVKDWRTHFFCEHHMDEKTIPKWEGVRSKRFKYAKYYEEDVELLYDMEKDPDELVNLVDSPVYKSQLEAMRANTEAYRRQYPKCTTPDKKKKKAGNGKAKDIDREKAKEERRKRMEGRSKKKKK